MRIIFFFSFGQATTTTNEKFVVKFRKFIYQRNIKHQLLFNQKKKQDKTVFNIHKAYAEEASIIFVINH